MQRKPLDSDTRTLREPFKPIRRQAKAGESGAKSTNRKRHRKSATHNRTMRSVLAVVFVVVCLITSASLYFVLSRSDTADFSQAALNEELIPTESQSEDVFEEDLPGGLIDLSGDPILIPTRQKVASRIRRKLLSEGNDIDNLSANGEIFILEDRLFASEAVLETALPANQQNFAFYAAANAVKKFDTNRDENSPENPSGVLLQNQQSESVDVAELTDDRLEDTQEGSGKYGSTVLLLKSPNDAEFPSRVEEKAKILHEVSIEDFLTQKNIIADEATLLADKIRQSFSIESFPAGLIVAYRAIAADLTEPAYVPTQISIYGPFGHVGSLARADNGQYISGEDPWFGQDLHRSGDGVESAGPSKVRLLDGIYGSAVRNNVPTQVVGEAILLLSKAHNLEVPASSSDTLQIVYSGQPRSLQTGFGRVLFVRVSVKSSAIECYVVQRPEGQFECVSGNGEITKTSGMVTPVRGVLTSKFGPRKHPILKKVHLHKGVDWAAPEGTPVVAAFSGVVKYSGVKGEYGNFIRLEHSDGRGTGYAHLQDFADGMRVGKKIKAGQIIGFVGSTGQSIGPHLHFELYRNGKAQDPFGEYTRVVQGGGAVQILVNQIIRVESAGDPNAKNPLSTATGLGQFIESTWMRMIGIHRPDVLEGKTRAQVLALRTDPDLARAMTTALAQGNANKLRASGQPVTPGNLYLAHFLGVDGAATALRAEPSRPLSSLYNAEIIEANPFLRGQTASWVINWAARKMKQKGGYMQAAKKHKVIVESDSVFLKYRAAIDAIL